jgi:hypothetical protein
MFVSCHFHIDARRYKLSPAVRRSGYFDALVDIDRLLRD